MNKSKPNYTGLIVLLTVFFFTGIFNVYVFWQKSTLAEREEKLMKERFTLNRQIRMIDKQIKEIEQKERRINLVFLKTTEVYDYFTETALRCGMTIDKISMEKVSQKDATKQAIPLLISMEGNYRRMLQFFEYLAQRQFVFMIDKIELRKQSMENVTLSLVLHINIPLAGGA